MSMLRLTRHTRGLGLSPRRRKAQGAALPSIVQDGLVAEWRFDEGAGQVLTDYTGNGHHGQLGPTSGVDTQDPAWSSQGLAFTGGEGDYVECDTAGISGGVARTVIAVLRTSADPSPDNGAFGLEWRSGGPSGTRWTLRESAAGLAGRLRFESNDGASVYDSGLVTGTSAGGGDWHFLGASQSGSNENTVRLFVDGAFENVTTSFVLNTGGNFFWATKDASSQSIIAAYGLVYNRALSDEEIEQNRTMLAQKLWNERGILLPGFEHLAESTLVQSGPIAWYKFDDGSGQQVTDHSGNGNHGQLGPTAGVDASEPTWAGHGVDCTINHLDNHVRLASAGTLGISGGAPRTLIAVVQGNRVDANTDYPGLGSWAGSGALGERFWFGPGPASNALRLQYGTGGNLFAFTGLTMVNETWHFAALTLAGANVNTAVAYLDGASVAATTDQALNTTGNFAMTGRNGADAGNLQWSKHAYQLVYDRALSPAEIEQSRQALKSILAGRGITLP